jgi:Xaa-Pro aminopeptidase
MFEPSVYEGRRRALVSLLAGRGLNSALVAFTGNRESPMNYTDNAYRFRQDSCLLYYFGIAEPDLAGTLDLASGKATLYANELTMDDLVWTGPRPCVDEYRALCAAQSAAPRSRYGVDLSSSKVPILFVPPYRAETMLELSQALGLAPDRVAAAGSVPLIQAVVAQRELKEPREVAQIEEAVDTTIAMHKAVIAAAEPGVTEAQLMAEAYRVAYAGGGMPSFPAIATTKGAVLHNHGYPGNLAAGGLFLLDAGAETASGYAGDLTSTFPVSRSYTDRQKAIYQIVLDAGAAGAALLGPGTPFRAAHLAAARTIAAGLKGLGIMRGDVDEAVAAGAHACFFPHGLGHQMGLDVHDMENLGEVWVGYDGEPKSTVFGLKSLRMAKSLKAGMVMTVEPGIYFIAGLIAAWKAEKRHAAFIDYAEAERWLDLGGVRNEEDWLVVVDGARRLGGTFDKSVTAMEGYRA